MKMKTWSNSFLTKFMSLLLFVVHTLVALGQTEMGMYLGSMSFVKPSPNITRSSRSLSMKMATKALTSGVYAKVGGVAFIQTAEPEFKIKSISVHCDSLNNCAYAEINGNNYVIPLSVWQLQPIVEFVSDENNAIVSLYGNDQSRIIFHSAYLDKLLGLRLLQTDMLPFLPYRDSGKFPTYDNGDVIMGDSEKRELNDLCKLYDIEYGKGYRYERLCKQAKSKYWSALDSIGEKYQTYIYTDYNEPIKFSVRNDSIIFSGHPYYRYANWDSLRIDTLEAYYEIKNFVDTFQVRYEMYNNLSFTNCFKKETANLTHDLLKVSKDKKNSYKKAKKAFSKLNYYEYVKGNNMSSIIDDYEDTYNNLKVFADSVIQSKSVNGEYLVDDEYLICNNARRITDKFDFYSAPIICEYVDSIYRLLDDSRAEKMWLQMKKITYDDVLIWHVWKNRVSSVEECVNSTNYFRNEGYEIVKGLNPFIIKEAEETCQWSAFFRFVQEKNPKNWDLFIRGVSRLKYDAPNVWTPIDYK